MSSFALFLFFLLCLLAFVGSSTPTYSPTDKILLDCGSNSSTPDSSKRIWEGDAHSKYSPPNIATISNASEATEGLSAISNAIPYTTARVFESHFTYSFPVLAGPKFLRLYFYPATYSGLNKDEFFFSVTANEFTLLSNYSAYLTSIASLERTLVKEFIISVEENLLNITFLPSPRSFAFINGIEIVSMPDTIYFTGNDRPIKFNSQLFYMQNTTALETLYRLNVGGSPIRIEEDTGMFRKWSSDYDYISGGDFGYTPHATDHPINYSLIPAYLAPEIVYTTSRVINGSKSLEWSFPVDSGFHYLLRLHFCEIQLEVTRQNERVFSISINNEATETEADVIYWTGGIGIPIFKDYVTFVNDVGHLRLSLYPFTLHLPKYNNALLNGLEIFKLRHPGLAAVNPDVSSAMKKTNSKGSSVRYPVIGSVIGVLAILLSVSFLIFRYRWRLKDNGIKTGHSGSSPRSDLCRHFLFEEIQAATDNFNDSFVIGMGGFGKVYKGYIDKGKTVVAIKRLNPSSSQGIHEFETEIQMLSTLRHRNLVSLIGYCDQRGEMILVYDYMVHGALRDHLYNSKNSPLPWKNRLQIVVGAANGLQYLHTGVKHVIIHRDVKSTNILLDEKWVAKVSDFGLSRIGPTDESGTHVSTMVKGSFGYLDPEYYMRQQLRDKSDVYSFGVVLFEVLCARPPIIPNTQETQVNLAEWAKFCDKNGTVGHIVDPNLEGQNAPECLSKYVDIAIKCLRDNGTDRPTMSEVVSSLEVAMQLQVAADNKGSGELAVDNGSSRMPLSGQLLLPTISGDETFSRLDDAQAKSKSAISCPAECDILQNSSNTYSYSG